VTRAAVMTGSDPAAGADDRPAALLRRGRILEAITLGWKVAGIIVLTFAAIGARSVALAGFGLDSLIEIGASIVVLWELSGTGEDRQRRGLRLIGGAFLLLAAYLTAQSAIVLATGYHPAPVPSASPGQQSPRAPCSLSRRPRPAPAVRSATRS
jgi:hypothetical protein